MKDRSAIILLGGGMTSAYGAGFLSELFKLNLFPDIVIASSGNAGNATYYVSKDPVVLGYATKNWFQYITTKEFIDMKRASKMVDIDYLIDDVLRMKSPMDITKVMNSDVKLYISATNVKTVNIDFYSNKDDVDLFELLRAAKSVPYYYNKHVKIRDGFYLDLAPLTNFNEYLNICKSENIKKVIVVNNQADSVFGNILIVLYSALFINFNFIKKIINVITDNKELKLKKSGLDYLYFKNSQVGTFDNSVASVKGSFLKGQEDALKSIQRIKQLI